MIKIFARGVFIATLFTILCGIFIAPSLTYAAADCIKSGADDPGHTAGWDINSFKNDPACLSDPVQAKGYIGDVIGMVLNLVLIAGALGAFVMLIYGAYQYILAQGDPGKAAQGRKAMIYAVAGLIIMAMVYVFILIYNNILPS